MPLETRLMIGCFVALAAALVLAVTKVLGAWADHHISRHDLIVESRRRRLAYFNAVAERMSDITDEEAADNDSVIIEDEDNDQEDYAKAA